MVAAAPLRSRARRILDGGLAAWRAAGGALEAGCGVRHGNITARPRGDDIADADELAAGCRPVVLVDARAAERYRGEREPIDPVAGHIPGAANVPFAELAPGGRFLPPGELSERLAAAGVVPGADVVAYCGSGVSATVCRRGRGRRRDRGRASLSWLVERVVQTLGLAPERTTLT